MIDSLAIQSKEFEETKNELEESKHEITSLRKKIESLENLAEENRNVSANRYNCDSGEEDIKDHESELQSMKENLALAEEGEKQASLKAKSPHEIELLKNELKLAIEAEEKSAKAMEDLALALKEVATEANQAKEKLNNSQMELVQVRSEAEGLKAMVQSTKERYRTLLDEAKQEAELYRNAADRLKLEAEESLLAWNGKEMGFIGCIKRSEEEKATVQRECTKLRESLKAAEHTSMVAREETFKLRDILKQAINEANAAKVAAGIAMDENSQLKDCLSEKDDALLFLTRENERLRINEAAARENMKEYKKLLSTASTELKIEDKEQYIMLKPPDSMDHEHGDENMNRTFSFNLEDLKFMNDLEDAFEKDLDEDPEKAEALKGSIFDANAETPKAEPRTPQSASSHRRLYSSPFTDDGGTPNLEDFDHLDIPHDDPDSDRNSHRRRRTMFRRVGDLLMIRRSFHKKEPSTEYHKKESSTENHKKESSTESHKKEPSNEIHKKESSMENHKKEPSTE
ncbi:putative WEB family protein [Forsythia ovata]|uniref:WEB family protein n=1 Tax=Forsythia ovata TaxID=205694 RepID=A0ABD1U9I4_9LAMI